MEVPDSRVTDEQANSAPLLFLLIVIIIIIIIIVITIIAKRAMWRPLGVTVGLVPLILVRL